MNEILNTGKEDTEWELLDHDAEIFQSNLKRNKKFMEKKNYPLNLLEHYPLSEVVSEKLIQMMAQENQKIKPDWLVKIETGEVYASKSLENNLPANTDYIVYNFKKKPTLYDTSSYRLF